MRLDEVLKERQPPPGGLARLRQGLEDRDRRSHSRSWRGWQMAGLATLGLVVGLLVLGPGTNRVQPVSIVSSHDLIALGAIVPKDTKPLGPKGKQGFLKMGEGSDYTYWRMIRRDQSVDGDDSTPDHL